MITFFFLDKVIRKYLATVKNDMTEIPPSLGFCLCSDSN